MQNKILKKIISLFLILFISVGIVLGSLQIGVAYQQKNGVVWTPDYEKINILPLLKKTKRTEADYAVLYEQTGLTSIGIEETLACEGIYSVLAIQDQYFGEYEVFASSFAPFTYVEEIEKGVRVAALQEGDILISLSVYTSFFRYGHCGLVSDEEKGMVIECISIGTLSEEASVASFLEYTNFLVFRPKMDRATRKAVAAYAKEFLVGLPYDIATGILSKKFKETLDASQCAHLVWYAYKKFGLDLDATGGMLVTPWDLASSPNLELVQSFGINPKKIGR